MQSQSFAHNRPVAICATKDVGKASGSPWVPSFSEVDTLEKYVRRELLTGSSEFDEEVQKPPPSRMFRIFEV
jgi:hypothetical protein